jgi:ADP-ribosylglycohydrolase
MNRLTLLFTGLAAGDSLGSTSEFCSRSAVLDCYRKHHRKGWPFRQVGDGPFHWNPGDPTDDTDMATCLVKSWNAQGKFDPADVAKRFVAWMESSPPDIGTTTRSVLKDVQRGVSWAEAGRNRWLESPDSLANGSLMRNGVVAGFANSLENAWEMTLLHGMITHYAPLCQLCCAAQTWMIWRFLEGTTPLPADWIGQFKPEFESWLASTHQKQLCRWRDDTRPHISRAWDRLCAAEWDIDSFNPFEDTQSMGFVLLTLQVAWWALQWSLRANARFPAPAEFPSAVFQRTGPYVLGWVAMIGKDSDTYGATAGPLIAAAHGGLPVELTDGLKALEALH